MKDYVVLALHIYLFIAATFLSTDLYKVSLEVSLLDCISNQPREAEANCLNYCLRARWGD